VLFTSFEHTAFRLEVRRRYNPSYEDESLRKFLAGEAVDLSWMQAWSRMVREGAAEGRRVARVRVVDLPMSEWNRYSYALAEHNIDAGEDIRYLARDQAPAGLPGYDYWLFDSSKLVVMRFDDDDRFVGGELVEDPSGVVRANYWRDAAWHWAVRRDDFASEPSGQRA
jgi:hypothetical protein